MSQLNIVWQPIFAQIKFRAVGEGLAPPVASQTLGGNRRLTDEVLPQNLVRQSMFGKFMRFEKNVSWIFRQKIIFNFPFSIFDFWERHLCDILRFLCIKSTNVFGLAESIFSFVSFSTKFYLKNRTNWTIYKSRQIVYNTKAVGGTNSTASRTTVFIICGVSILWYQSRGYKLTVVLF